MGPKENEKLIIDSKNVVFKNDEEYQKIQSFKTTLEYKKVIDKFI